MKIISLKAENIKRLKAIEIQADGKSVILAGPNGSGKTSTMDAIWSALQFSRANKAMDATIRQGEESAEASVDLGEYIVTRKWTEGGSTITVKDKEGRKFTSPQAILDGLIGNLAFDPLEFSSMSTDRQTATLIGLAKLDLSEYDNKHRELYDARTIANKKVKDLIAKGSTLAKPEAHWPEAEVPFADLNARLKVARIAAGEKSDHDNLLRQLVSDIEKLKEDLRLKEEKLIFAKENPPAPYDGPAVADIEKDISELEEKNKLARARIAHAAIAAEYRTAKTEADATQENFAKNVDERKKAIAGATYPLPGLSINDETMGVVFNGQSWRDMSTGERLRVSTAMAMAMNPRLRVIFLRDASLLDDANMAAIRELASEHDYQIWVEVIKSDDPTAVHFSEGSIVTSTEVAQ